MAVWKLPSLFMHQRFRHQCWNEIFKLVLLRFRESNCGKTTEADHNTRNLSPLAAYQFKPEGPVIADLRQRKKKNPESVVRRLCCILHVITDWTRNKWVSRNYNPNAYFPTHCLHYRSCSESPACLLFGYVTLAQLATKQLGRLNGATLGTVCSCQMAGKLETLVWTTWGGNCNQFSHFLEDCSHQRTIMQNVSICKTCKISP